MVLKRETMVLYVRLALLCLDCGTMEWVRNGAGAEMNDDKDGDIGTICYELNRVEVGEDREEILKLLREEDIPEEDWSSDGLSSWESDVSGQVKNDYSRERKSPLSLGEATGNSEVLDLDRVREGLENAVRRKANVASSQEGLAKEALRAVRGFSGNMFLIDPKDGEVSVQNVSFVAVAERRVLEWFARIATFAEQIAVRLGTTHSDLAASAGKILVQLRSSLATAEIHDITSLLQTKLEVEPVARHIKLLHRVVFANQNSGANSVVVENEIYRQLLDTDLSSCRAESNLLVELLLGSLHRDLNSISDLLNDVGSRVAPTAVAPCLRTCLEIAMDTANTFKQLEVLEQLLKQRRTEWQRLDLFEDLSTALFGPGSNSTTEKDSRGGEESLHRWDTRRYSWKVPLSAPTVRSCHHALPIALMMQLTIEEKARERRSEIERAVVKVLRNEMLVVDQLDRLRRAVFGFTVEDVYNNQEYPSRRIQVILLNERFRDALADERRTQTPVGGWLPLSLGMIDGLAEQSDSWTLKLHAETDGAFEIYIDDNIMEKYSHILGLVLNLQKARSAADRANLTTLAGRDLQLELAHIVRSIQSYVVSRVATEKWELEVVDSIENCRSVKDLKRIHEDWLNSCTESCFVTPGSSLNKVVMTLLRATMTLQKHGDAVAPALKEEVTHSVRFLLGALKQLSLSTVGSLDRYSELQCRLDFNRYYSSRIRELGE